MSIRWIKRIIAGCHGISEYSGRIVSWLTLAMVLVTFLIVVLRYQFNMGWIALQESVTYMHALVFLIGSTYTLKHDGHVRVDIFYRHFSERTQAWVNLLGTVLMLFPVAGLILWTGWDYVLSSWRLLEGSREAGGLPFVYLLKSAIPLMAILLIVQGIADTLLNILRLVDKESV